MEPGPCIFMKRLERGRFADLWSDRSGAPVRLTSSELALFIEGCALVGKKIRPIRGKRFDSLRW
jgi:transposase